MGIKRKIYFRADAGQSIGYGHFIRSLALADMLKNDFDCTFFTQTPTEYQIREAEEVCPLVALPADDSRFGIFLNMLRGEEIVVLDNYFFSSDYQKQIKLKGCRLVCIDDVHDRHFYADVIINHCINSCDDYDAEPETRFFVGSKWALLRSPFLQKQEAWRNRNHWIITFGGSDPYNLTLKYIRTLRQCHPDAMISAMVGDGYAYMRELDSFSNVRVYSKLTAQAVADLFNSAGNVVCSASSVCYEALSCGCSVYAGYYVDNQLDFYNNLVQEGLIVPLGSLLEDIPASKLSPYANSDNIVFPDIAEHYRMVFRALCYEVVKYQDMTMAQSKEVWLCRNNESIRKWMACPDPFSFESHCSFVSGLIDNRTKLYYSFFDGDKFVGSYDFIGIADGIEAERGLFVNPEYQGRHIASMMETFMDGEIVKRGVKRLVSEVLIINRPSFQYHIRAGYHVVDNDSRYYYLERFI